MPDDCHEAHFRFYEELNDFLPEQQRKQCFVQPFRGSPAIKDTIEAVGVPHTEIDLILVNGQSVDFDSWIAPFTRCTGCNGLIRRVQKAAVLEQIPPNIGERYDDYFRCESCGKVYWKGSHFDQLRAYVAKVSDALGRCR